MSKREKVLLAIGGVAIVSPFVYGFSEELGWQGFLLALLILGTMGFSVAALFCSTATTRMNGVMNSEE